MISPKMNPARKADNTSRPSSSDEDKAPHQSFREVKMGTRRHRLPLETLIGPLALSEGQLLKRNRAALEAAIEKGRRRDVREVLSRDLFLLNEPNEAGARPLHIAVQCNCVKIVKLLCRRVESGLQVDARNEESLKTALHVAVENDNLECAQELIENGADVNAQDIYGCAPLHYAAKLGHTRMVKFLLGISGINLHLRDEAQTTALDYARSEGHEPCVIILLEKLAAVSDDFSWMVFDASDEDEAQVSAPPSVDSSSSSGESN